MIPARDPDADTILVPRQFAGYQCQRTMVCCHEPFAATVDDDDEVRLKAALAQTERGRAALETIDETIIDSLGEPGRREWGKEGGRCRHLVIEGDDATRGCGLHHIVGLDNLPGACRNFPRLVQSVDDHWEVAFQLGCPTAAGLLAADPAPMTIVSLPRQGYPFLPRGDAVVPPERRALRDAWWRVTAAGRASARDIMAVIGALLDAPTAPPVDGLPALSSSIEVPVTPLASMLIVHGLLRVPERGLHYADHAAALTNDLVGRWTQARLVASAESGPSLVAAFLDHQINQLIVFTKLEPEPILRMGAQRALAVLRVVDALCDRVPFRSRALFADAFSSCSRVNPALGRDAGEAGPAHADPAAEVEVRSE